MYYLVIGLFRAERAVSYACHYGVLAYAQLDGGITYGDTPRATPFGHSTLPPVRRIVHSLALRFLRGRICGTLRCVAVKACYTDTLAARSTHQRASSANFVEIYFHPLG